MTVGPEERPRRDGDRSRAGVRAVEERQAETGRSGDSLAIEIGRRLGAWWVVSGAYQRIGDRIRITAQLVEVLKGTLLRTLKIDGPRRRDLRAAGPHRLRSEPKPEREAGEGRGRRDRARRDLIGRSVRGLLSRRVEHAIGRPRRDRSRDRAVRAGRAARSEVRVGVGGARWRLHLEGRVPRHAAAAGARRSSRCAARSDSTRRSSVPMCGWAARSPDSGKLDEGLGVAAASGRDRAGQRRCASDAGARVLAVEGDGARRHRRAAQGARASIPRPGTRTCSSRCSRRSAANLDAAEASARQAIELQERAMSGTEGLLIVGAHSRLGYVHYLRGELRRGVRRVPPRAGVGEHERPRAARTHGDRAASEAQRRASRAR